MKSKLLVIEDNLEMRENIAEILELASYEVVTAENGKIGVKLAIAEIPDLIICDVMMPVMDGYETLYMLNQHDATKNVPFIFLTAKAEKSDLRKGMNEGADDYLTKPFEEMDLLKAVELRLQKSRELRQNFAPNASGISQLTSIAENFGCLKSISEGHKTTSYKRKDVLFREGDFANAVFLVESGKIKTFKMNEDGKELITGLFKEGDVIGYHAVINNTDYIESAATLEDAVVCRIPKEDFHSMLVNHKEVSHAFIKLLAGNVAEKEAELLHLAYDSVRKRVADGLLLLKKKYQVNQEDDFAMAISRDDLSSIVGTATESVIRVLKEFKEDGHIQVEGSKITILQAKELEELRY